MVTDPYDDDDQPTLQRPPTGSVKNASGVRAAFTVPVGIDEALDHGFGEETTAVDHVPLAANHDQTEALSDPPPPPSSMSPADDEGPTPSLPLELAKELLRMSSPSQPPPPPNDRDDQR